jgi:hypothetical protein
MNTFFKMLLAGMISVSAPVMADGGGSTAGGGPVVFQALAIKALLSSDALLFKFNHQKAIYIKSINHLSWADGTTNYELVTNGDCRILAQTVSDETGMNYEVVLGEMTCPE